MSKPAAKPPAKPAAAAPAEAEAAPPAKGGKKKIIMISVLALAIAGGAGWYFTKGHAPAEGHPKEVKAEPLHEPVFVSLGENFTVNLQREEGDQYLQAGITLKILDPELEGKIKKAMPEIKSKLLFLLSGKLPSELQTAEGKKKLVAEIIAEVDGVLGLAAEPANASAPASAPAHEAGHGEAAHPGTAASAPAAPQTATAPVQKTKGVVDVLFTSFIIQ